MNSKRRDRASRNLTKVVGLYAEYNPLRVGVCTLDYGHPLRFESGYGHVWFDSCRLLLGSEVKTYLGAYLAGLTNQHLEICTSDRRIGNLIYDLSESLKSGFGPCDFCESLVIEDVLSEVKALILDQPYEIDKQLLFEPDLLFNDGFELNILDPVCSLSDKDLMLTKALAVSVSWIEGCYLGRCSLLNR